MNPSVPGVDEHEGIGPCCNGSKRCFLMSDVQITWAVGSLCHPLGPSQAGKIELGKPSLPERLSATKGRTKGPRADDTRDDRMPANRDGTAIFRVE